MTDRVPVCSNGHPTALVGGLAIYPHRPDLAHLKFWACLPCDEFVGCHPDTEVPLGTPANPQLRAARRKAHASFDKLWRNGLMRRTAAYQWLRQQMGMTSQQCHMGKMDLHECVRVIALCDDHLARLLSPGDDAPQQGGQPGTGTGA